MLRKHKKIRGFTLVELLATIVVLGIVAGIVVVVNITGVFNNSKEKITKISDTNIVAASKNYSAEFLGASENWNPNSDNVTEYTCISINALIKKGIFKKKDFTKEDIERNIILTRDTQTKFINEVNIKKSSESKAECSLILPKPIININTNKSTENWYNQDVDFTITLEPNVTTIVDSIKYKIADETTKCNSKEQCQGKIVKNGKDIKLTAEVIGINGISQEETVSVNIDKTVPSINLSTDGNGSGNWNVKDVTVNFNVDNLNNIVSGVKKYYSSNFNDCDNVSEYLDYSEEKPLVISNEGENKICTKDVTGSGNESVGSIDIKIDKMAPKLESTTVSRNGKTVYGHFTVSDQGSGVAYYYKSRNDRYDGCSNIKYHMDKGDYKPVPAGGKIDTELFYDNNIWVVDKSGNCDMVESVTYIVSDIKNWSSKPIPTSFLNYPSGSIWNGGIKNILLSDDFLHNKSVEVIIDEAAGRVTPQLKNENLDIVTGSSGGYVTTFSNSYYASYESNSYYTCEYGHVRKGNMCTCKSGSCSYYVYSDYNNVPYTCYRSYTNGPLKWSSPEIDNYCSGNCNAPCPSRYDYTYLGVSSYDKPLGGQSCSPEYSRRTISFQFRAMCDWGGDYPATLESGGGGYYYCNSSNHYLDGSYCRYCSDSSYSYDRNTNQCRKYVEATETKYNLGYILAFTTKGKQ